MRAGTGGSPRPALHESRGGRANLFGALKGLAALIIGLLLLGGPPGVSAAETADPTSMTTTQVILTFTDSDALDLQTTYREAPPTIRIEFPRRRVVGSLPERSALQHGVVAAISSAYERDGRRGGRFMRSVELELRGRYPYRVESRQDRVIVEIDHPVHVARATVEVGLQGGTILWRMRPQAVSERFRAMQQAMAEAAAGPLRWEGQIRFPEPAEEPEATPSRVPGPEAAGEADRAPSGRPDAAPIPTRQGWLSKASVLAALGLIGGMLLGFWMRRLAKARAAKLGPATPQAGRPRPSAGAGLIELLVWRAVEEQGYQLVKTTEQQPGRVLRVIEKEGVSTGLMYVSDGLFIEKQAVEEFLRALQEVQLRQGILVAAGAFTVPAQRLADAQRITLVGREQLIELLGAGAASASLRSQLEHQQRQLEKANEALRIFAAQLDDMRTQRNESSWFLGEERAASAQLTQQVDDLALALTEHEQRVRQWEEEATKLRKAWEESQWYLGESRVRGRFLERQLSTLQEVVRGSEASVQDATKRIKQVEQQRDAANLSLGEECAKRVELEARAAALQHGLDESVARELALQDAFDEMRRKLASLESRGERRQVPRFSVPEASVEVYTADGIGVFSGGCWNLSGIGIGLETDKALPARTAYRVRVKLPGLRRPIESEATLVWRQASGQPPRYATGFAFERLSVRARTRLQERLDQTARA